MHDQLAKYIRNEIPVTDDQLHTILVLLQIVISQIRMRYC
jgi:hypothetical protein